MMPTFKQFLFEQFDTKFVYNDKLNPKLWDNKNNMHRDVHEALLNIADEFIDFLDDPDFEVQDIIVTGSQANFNYTAQSDIDLHIITTTTSHADETCAFSVGDFFKTKKSLWNEQHNIQIRGIPVELYVQLGDEPVVALGVYSILNNQWVEQPLRHLNVEEIDNYAVNIKAAEIKTVIDTIIDDKVDDSEMIKKLKEKIRLMRKAGLARGGEFSVENLTFKALRNAGYLDKLTDYQRQMQDVELSLK